MRAPGTSEGRTTGKAAFQAAAAAVLFSTGGAAIKTAALSGAQVASLRSGIAAVVLLLWLRGRVTWSVAAVGVGVVYAATLTLFVAATKLTTAANAIFLQSTAPLYVALLAPLLLRERFRARDAVSLAAVALGLWLCVTGGVPASGTAPDPATGNLLGAASGIVWALTLIGLRWLRTYEGQAMSAVVAGNLMAFVAGVPSLQPLPSGSVADWVSVAYLGVFQIGCAYILLTRAIARLPALHVSLLLLLEPVLNPVWAWLAQGETPGRWALTGGAVIVAANAVRAIRAGGGVPTAAPAK